MKISLPDAFVSRINAQLGDEANVFFDSLQLPVPTSIRYHHLKGRSSFEGKEKIPWCDTGYYLESRPFFHLDPHWHGGAYYVQEASSMILDDVLRQLKLKHQARIWLDLCAAPGGKTGILAKHLGPADVLIANEVVHQRKAILRENLVKAGYMNTCITGKPASAFHQPFADVILLDAPCAGEGMMRKDPEAIHQWTPALVTSCSAMQKQIIHDAIQALRPEGYLIYSTCSYSPEENIQNIVHTLSTYDVETVPLSFPAEWGITTVADDEAIGYQLFPHKVKGEGLFIAVMKKNASQDTSFARSRKPVCVFNSVPDSIASKLNDPSSFSVKKNSATHGLITTDAEKKANEVMLHLPDAEFVVGAGEIKGKDFIPSHVMAMADLVHPGNEIIDLDMVTALDYLERKTESLPSGKLPGWYLIRFDQTFLGWAKQTQQGWRNHYPMHWRLRDRKGR
jgi:16S rRNA C967 or C1407 C5-methylase (RsmB/RsmF family)/NOL1/NOP2/fmu family ribosome biogenesis protein